MLQIGNDVYCDTQLIARILDERCSEPSLFPSGLDFYTNTLAAWADSTLFQCAVAVANDGDGLGRALGISDSAELEAFRRDRAAFRQGSTVHRPPAAEARVQLGVYCRRLELQLADGRDFLSGFEPTLVDFCVYHPLWFLLRANPDALNGFSALDAWFVRMSEFGNGKSTEISSAEALEIARRTAPATLDRRFHQEGREFASGDTVEITPTDYGFDPSAGDIVMFDANEVAIYRRDPRAGEVLVHFPRIGYHIRKIETGPGL